MEQGSVSLEIGLYVGTEGRCLRQAEWSPYQEKSQGESLLAGCVGSLREREPAVGYSTRILSEGLVRDSGYTGSSQAVKMNLNSQWPIPEGMRDTPAGLRDITFLGLRRRFVFLPEISFQPVVATMLGNELCARQRARVLDIGCGRGIGSQREYQWYLKGLAEQLWGVEPDTDIRPPEGLFDHFQHATIEAAQLPEKFFDLAYCVFVMEHVAEPAHFFQAVFRALQDGGQLYVVTPNACAFFGFSSRWLSRLKVDEWVHRLLFRRSDFQPDHYPVVSRCNTPREFRRYARIAGFLEPEFAYGQFHGGGGYFPGPLQVFYRMLLRKRALMRRPSALDTMFCRLTKPPLNPTPFSLRRGWSKTLQATAGVW